MPVFNQKARKTAVIGDTGCKDPNQNCADQNQWPFQIIAQNIKQKNPDFLIHVGDYNYRSTGDAWANWKADFFEPASSILTQAPWLFIRGNHEICSRNGEGFFRLFGTQKTCQDYTKPYLVKYAGLSLIAFDNSFLLDRNQNEAPMLEVAKKYSEQLKALAAFPKSWLVMHEPIWAIDSKLRLYNPTFQAAFKSANLSNISLVLSGHKHLFEALSFADNLPAQLIIGMSGTELEDALPDTSQVQFINRPAKLKVTNFAQHGHALITAPNLVQIYGVNNQILKTLRIQNNQLNWESPQVSNQDL